MNKTFFDFKSSSKPYFIADIAANHDGSINRAKDLIWLAKEAGADCAKFQHFLADEIVNGDGFSKLNAGRTHQSSWKKSTSEVYEQYHFKREWTVEIYRECVKAEIDFSSTPYDQEAIRLISDLVPFIKIGSGDISWIEHILACADTDLPIVLASGASTDIDVKRAMQVFDNKANQLCLMQCNTNYTVDADKIGYVNLRVLEKYKDDYPGVILGLSDHTLTDTSVMGAIALGAKVIEKHFTDDNKRVGPDHEFAVNPQNWRIMVDKANELTLALGDGIKRVEKNEIEAFKVQRRSCTVAHDLKKGDVVTRDDICYLRPCPPSSFHPFEADMLIGKKVRRDMAKNEIFLSSDIENL